MKIFWYNCVKESVIYKNQKLLYLKIVLADGLVVSIATEFFPHISFYYF